VISVCKVAFLFFAPPVLSKGRNNIFDILYKNQLFNLVPELSYKLIRFHLQLYLGTCYNTLCNFPENG